MIKLLILNNFIHHKNKEGLIHILNLLNYEYKIGTIDDIENYDIVYSPSAPVDIQKYPHKKFIFGPHFSVFPDHNIKDILNNPNYIYIFPSIWTKDMWTYLTKNSLRCKVFSFPVNMSIFKPIDTNIKDKVLIYYKRRNPADLEYLKDFLRTRGVEYTIFNYLARYSESDYLDCLQRAKYMIVLDAHESQGFALEEAMSCNVPLLVWNVKTLNQEYRSRYPPFPATTIPYWSETCGEAFTEKEQFESTYEKFISNLETYSPRKFIEDNLSVEKCANNFVELIRFEE